MEVRKISYGTDLNLPIYGWGWFPMLKWQAADLVECFIREFVPPPADPSWDVGGKGSVLFVTLFSHRLTPRGM